MKNYILFILFSIVSSFGYSQALDSIRDSMKDDAQPLNSDRPGQTYNASTVGKGVLMTQLGLDIGGHRLYKWDLESTSVKGLVELRYGLLPNLEIGGMYYGFSNKIDNDSIPDADRKEQAFGGNVRYNLKETDHSTFGLLLDYANYNDDLGSSGAGTLKFLYGVKLSETFNLTGNLGYSYGGEDPSGNFLYTLNLGAGFFEDFGVFLESYGFVYSESSDIWIDGGLWYMINPHIQWDVLFSKGFNNNVQDYFLSTGLTWRIHDTR
jgi:hypothetical protein